MHVEVLGGGITNHNLKVEVDGEAFVLRVAGKDTGLLGIDRTVELAATRAAAALGIGPEVVAFVEPEGWLVTRFVEGAIPPMERMHEPAMLERVARGVARIPRRPAHPRVRSTRSGSSRPTGDTALDRGGAVPDGYEWAHEIARRIEARRSADAARPLPQRPAERQLPREGERLWIVDWEYAGMGDRFFDLANFSINHELGADEREALLVAYFGELRSEDAAALELMRFMSDFREAMWGVVQSAVSELDFDFDAYASEHFERLRRTAAEPDFQQALAR